MPRCSIIIRTAGRRKDMFAAALDSALAQTEPDLEIVVVEDGGTHMAERVRNRPTQRSLRYVPLANVGRSAAGNAGLAAATGRYVGFLDDDDALYPEHVARLADALDAAPDAVAAYGFAHEVFVAGHGDGEGLPRERHRRVVGEAVFSSVLLHVRNPFPLQSVLFRHDLYDKLGGFDEALDYLEDWDLWLRYATAGRFIAVPEVTSMFRMPAEWAALKARAASHEAPRGRVLAKHAASPVATTAGEIAGLHRDFVERADDYISARDAIGRVLRRLVRGW